MEASADVLVVDDDPTVSEVVAAYLRRSGHQVRLAADGPTAVAAAALKRPDLIVLDLMLPEIDGWQVRRAMQDDPRLADIPVVVVSALDASRCPDAAGHIQKPFQPQQLLEAIRRQTA